MLEYYIHKLTTTKIVFWLGELIKTLKIGLKSNKEYLLGIKIN
jgi:hypothetical protein